MKPGQSVTPIEDLKIDITLRAGESIVLAPIEGVADLGKVFFGAHSDDLNADESGAKSVFAKHRMVMIRVVQTQMDDLFSDGSIGEKLTSTPRH